MTTNRVDEERASRRDAECEPYRAIRVTADDQRERTIFAAGLTACDLGDDVCWFCEAPAEDEARLADGRTYPACEGCAAEMARARKLDAELERRGLA